MFITKLGEQIRKARIAQKLSIKDLSRKTGIDEQSLIALENGKCDRVELITNVSLVKPYLHLSTAKLSGLVSNAMVELYYREHEHLVSYV